MPILTEKEEIMGNQKWEKHPRGGELGFKKNFLNTTNLSTKEANIKR